MCVRVLEYMSCFHAHKHSSTKKQTPHKHTRMHALWLTPLFYQAGLFGVTIDINHDGWIRLIFIAVKLQPVQVNMIYCIYVCSES